MNPLISNPHLHFFSFYLHNKHKHFISFSLSSSLTDASLCNTSGMNNSILGLPKARIWYILAIFPEFLKVAMVDNWVLWLLLLHFIYTVVASGYQSQVGASYCDISTYTPLSPSQLFALAASEADAHGKFDHSVRQTCLLCHLSMTCGTKANTEKLLLLPTMSLFASTASWLLPVLPCEISSSF